MRTLDNIAIDQGTDKSSLGHNYAVKYDKIFSPHRFKYDKILEIGVDGGASLRMWKEYFPLADIIGIDNCKDKISLIEDRIKILIADQGNANDLNSIKEHGKFDLIVDDGSHRYDHQILSFEILFDSIKPGGIYIVEDVCTSYWPEYGYGNAPITTIDYFKKLVDEVNFNGVRVNKLSDRRESLLLPEVHNKGILKFNCQIESIQFLNSSIIVYKR